MKAFTIALFSFSLILFSACKKVEGTGGTSKIVGKIIENKYNSVNALVATYDAMDQDVFIVYGEGKQGYDEKVSTSYDGTFEIPYLQKGKYTIFVYEDCNTCGSGKAAIVKSIEITKKKNTTDLGTIAIKKL